MNGDRGLNGPVGLCPKCGSSAAAIKWYPETDHNFCHNCGWDSRGNRETFISEFDKTELQRCAVGCDYILSKYPYYEDDSCYITAVCRAKSLARELLQIIESLPSTS